VVLAEKILRWWDEAQYWKVRSGMNWIDEEPDFVTQAKEISPDFEPHELDAKTDWLGLDLARPEAKDYSAKQLGWYYTDLQNYLDTGKSVALTRIVYGVCFYQKITYLNTIINITITVKLLYGCLKLSN